MEEVETNAERLETTKESVLHARKFIGADGILRFQYGEKVLDDFDWVIEQAEKSIDTEDGFWGRLAARQASNINELQKELDELQVMKRAARDNYLFKLQRVRLKAVVKKNNLEEALRDILNALVHDEDSDYAEEIAVRALKGESYK